MSGNIYKYLADQEPQEGARETLGPAGNEPETSGEPEQPSPVPSCDSELEAIRERINSESVYEDGGYLSLDEGRTLLRMVDELTGALRDEKQGAEQWLDRCRAAMKERDFQAQRASDAQTILSAVSKERDDLRAKLDDAARIHVEAEAKHAYRVKELEAKLAEAEKARAMSEQWLEHNAKGQQMMVDDLTIVGEDE